MIHYTNCPICNSENIQAQFSAKDFTVSQKLFSIWHCNNCSARFTQDVPSVSEIGAYYISENYISHSDTQKGLINRLYHLVRKRTLQSKKRLIIKKSARRVGKLLDVGCGTGAFLKTMLDAGWSVTGLEPDANARAKALSLYNIQPLESNKLFELQPSSFDVITMWHVLEHVHDLHAYIKQLSVLLSPGGKIFIAVPNYTSFDAKVYAENWAAYDVPRHLYHFSPKSVTHLLTTYNLILNSCHPMWFDSFYVSMLSEQNKNGNIIKAFWNGFISNLKAMVDNKKCSSVIYVISCK